MFLNKINSFGFGLSYTLFSYHDLSVETVANLSVKVTVGIQNDGSQDGSEVP